MAERKGRTVAIVGGGALTLAGVIVLLIGISYATGSGSADNPTLTTRGLMTLAAGAVMFAVGAMTTLVAIVRPLFEKRHIDHQVDAYRQSRVDKRD